MTVGHSTRSIEDFVELLKAHGVKRLVDVRTVPRSRRNPQFNREALPQALKPARISYTHMPQLGGLRHPRADSQNTAWRNTSFRGYADYMQTPDFAKGLGTLLELAGKHQMAVMCAEAVPWRCHRSLIADALVARGIQAEHIMSVTYSLGTRGRRPGDISRQSSGRRSAGAKIPQRSLSMPCSGISSDWQRSMLSWIGLVEIGGQAGQIQDAAKPFNTACRMPPL
jgi:uncharacterized protein (DUF488 family)